MAADEARRAGDEDASHAKPADPFHGVTIIVWSRTRSGVVSFQENAGI